MSSGLRHLVGTIDNCRSWDILEYIDSSWTVSYGHQSFTLNDLRSDVQVITEKAMVSTSLAHVLTADCKDLSLSHERARYIHQLPVWMQLLVFQLGHVHVPF
jgi:hypothetical protein